jgi:hypothetical protein
MIEEFEDGESLGSIRDKINKAIEEVNTMPDVFTPAINKIDKAFTLGYSIVPTTPVVISGGLPVAAFGASTARGFGFPVGVITDFNRIDLDVVVAAIETFRITVKEETSTGIVILDKVVSGNFGGAGRTTLSAEFPIIKNEDRKRLWVEVRTPVRIQVYANNPAQVFTEANGYPTYAATTISDISDNTMIPTGTGRIDVYAKFSGYIYAYDPDAKLEATPELKTIIQDEAKELPIILPNSVIDASIITNSLFSNGFVAAPDKITFDASVGPNGGNYFGFGFHVGVVQNFDKARTYIYKTTGTPTKFKCVIRKNNKDGEILGRATINQTLAETKTLIEFVFPSIIENTSGDRLWMEVYADGAIGYYIRFPVVDPIFTEAAGYTVPYVTTTTTAYADEALTTARTAYQDVWSSFNQYRYSTALTQKGKELLGTVETVTPVQTPGYSLIQATNLRFSFGVSSVTWFDGFLQSGFVGDFIKKQQSELATAILPANVSVIGSASNTLLNDRVMFLGQGRKITGVNAEIRFELSGNEVTICQKIERSNTNASVFEVFADDVKIGEFNNFNPTALGSESKSFTGDGASVKFDLGRAFTYNHALSVAGVIKIVELNTQSSGYVFPANVDAVIIRKYSSGPKPEVHHWLWFKAAPANGSNITISFTFGEEINYERTSIGKTGAGVLESAYGDGVISYDTTAPASISSGLDFRQTDDRSITQFRFSESKTRKIRIKIKGNYGSATGTPYLAFNFATNRFFHFQNAGIGGYEIFELSRNISEEYNLSWQRIVEFKPDVMFLDTAPNEDWIVRGHKIYKKYTGTPLADLRKAVAMPIRRIAYNSTTSSYDWDRWVGQIANIDETSVTLRIDASHVVDATPVKGDIVLMGTYFSDNREYIERIIESYDAGTGKITFNTPISENEHIYNNLFDLVGLEVRVRSYAIYTDKLTDLMGKFKGVLPETKIAIMPNPLPNINSRELWGYDLVLRQLSKQLGFTTLGGKSVEVFQKSQYRDKSFTIQASALLTDPVTGYKYAELTPIINGGNTIFPQILINGINVHGVNAFVENGWTNRVDPSKSGAQLNKAATDRVDKNLISRPFAPRLIFTKNPPTSGSIVVNLSSNLWSADSCHINANSEKLYGDIYFNDFVHTATK